MIAGGIFWVSPFHPVRRQYRLMSTDSTYDHDDDGSLPTDDDAGDARASAERRSPSAEVRRGTGNLSPDCRLLFVALLPPVTVFL